MSHSPEAIVEGKKRPFTGAEFVSPADGREVYIYGERVADVTKHPAFRNSVASVALLYDALHDPKTKDVLTAPTDTGSGGLHAQIFKVAAPPKMSSRNAMYDRWPGPASPTAGWAAAPTTRPHSSIPSAPMPSSTESSPTTPAPGTSEAQESVLYLNHALVNPPIDRNKPVEQVRTSTSPSRKETDAGIYVSAPRSVHQLGPHPLQLPGPEHGPEITDPSMVVMFIAPMDTPGIKLICRPSYEFAAAATGSPWDYPLTSRFDENDAIFVFDNAFIPWENVIVHRDVERLKSFYPRSGFFNGFTLQGAPGSRSSSISSSACSTRPRAPPAWKRSVASRPRSAR